MKDVRPYSEHQIREACFVTNELLGAEVLVSAVELGRRLGVNEGTVYARERQGELFSVLSLPSASARGFPLFQALPAIRGAILSDVLALLVDRDGNFLGGPAAHTFFCAPIYELAFLTPVELLVGAITGKSESADALSRKPRIDRQWRVKNAAKVFSDVCSA